MSSVQAAYWTPALVYHASNGMTHLHMFYGCEPHCPIDESRNGKRTTLTGPINRVAKSEHLANWQRGPNGEYLHHLECSTCGEKWNPWPGVTAKST